ncbi:energy transducer TonB [Winogradskyella sediminis]|uniref:Outer membrane transport energization protein TonB n=1 Tax=Winogradskyella sediminis TaxID=1382466 RepID=A0A1H1MIG5_9FLAO|nr:energy transducer TonB [Winogradskyella sediminis]REG84630.1 outer membrane transport energization protein TonB [Winogradskyella sediminis]SDR86526.1 outer membrane transport energization protein TonB [Winogradskyella sediminis]
MELKKNPKANVGRNSSLFFAVGLNVMLLLTYIGLEHKTYDKEAVKVDLLMLEDQYDEDIPITVIDVLPPPPPPQQQVVSEVITIVEDVDDVEETVIQSTEIGQDDIIDDREVGIEEVEVEEVEEDVEVPFALIEKVPQFPGCTGNNAELRACFERKIQEHLQKHFRYPPAAAELNIDGKVFVFFLIDKTGRVTKVKSRGPDRLLETEAERIINLLPKMEPGKQRDMNVGVPYSIPINFKLELN